MNDLAQAIARSKAYTEPVRVDFDGDLCRLIDDLQQLEHVEMDHAEENDGTIDIWGYVPGSEDDMAWRLKVSLPDGAATIVATRQHVV